MKALKYLIVLFAISFSVQAEMLDDPAATVNTDGNTYENRFFGMSVTRPDGWYAQSVEEMLMTQQKGSKALAGDNKNLQAMLDAAKDSSLPLFGFYEYPPGTPGKINPNVLAVAENIKQYPGIAKPCDYISAVKSLLEMGQVEYIFEGDCKSSNVGGRESGYLDAMLDLGKLKIKQRYHATISNGYAVSFIETYTDEENSKKVKRVINSIQFDR